MKKPFIKNNKALKAAYTAASVLFILLLWQLLSSALFKDSAALPPPFEVFAHFFKELSNAFFYKAVFSTLLKSFTGFLLAFIFGSALGIAAKLSVRAKYFIEPFLSILRSMPTLGVTFILLIFYPSTVTAVVIGMLVSLPLVYANSYAALSNIDSKLIEMAGAYKIGRLRQITGVYIPSCLPYFFASVLGGFGLNLKVTVAAEIVSIPRLSIGSYLNGAYVSADFTALFSWVLTAILLNFLCEIIIKLVTRLSMPHKYHTRKKLTAFFKRLFKRGKNKSTINSTPEESRDA